VSTWLIFTEMVNYLINYHDSNSGKLSVDEDEYNLELTYFVMAVC